MDDDLLKQWKLTNMLLAKIYGTILSSNPNLKYVDQEDLKKEIDVVNKMINVFCGDILDE